MSEVVRYTATPQRLATAAPPPRLRRTPCGKPLAFRPGTREKVRLRLRGSAALLAESLWLSGRALEKK